MQRDGHALLADIITEVSRVVVGKNDIKELLLVALLSQGHVLIEGLPGTAKTTIARTFAIAIGGKFKRVQGTPDMLPADILGFYLYRPDGGSAFMPGPIFANVVLFDELNRTTPRTLAALLEAMQERQVTIERTTHPLDSPFIVLASQVPYGGLGTAPVGDVQTDRFMLRLWSGLPSTDEEDHLLKDIDAISEPDTRPVATAQDIIELQQVVRKVHVADDVRGYIIALLDRLRRDAEVAIGPSPRAGIALFRGARALAYIQGRDFVIPDDVKRLLMPVLHHRLRVSAEAEIDEVTPEAIIARVATEVPAPRAGAGGGERAPIPVTETTSPPIERRTHRAEEKPILEAITSVPPLPGKTAPEAVALSQPGEWGGRGLSSTAWALVVVALIMGAVMLSVGLLSLRP